MMTMMDRAPFVYTHISCNIGNCKQGSFAPLPHHCINVCDGVCVRRWRCEMMICVAQTMANGALVVTTNSIIE